MICVGAKCKNGGTGRRLDDTKMPSDRLFVLPFLHFARWNISTARKIISYKIGAQLSRAGKTVGTVAYGRGYRLTVFMD
jgi:hypothetical protein